MPTETTLPFADRLAAAVRARRTPVLVGLDPRWDQLPEPLRATPTASPQAKADAYAEFCRGVIDVVAPLVPAVKPQAAFFEELGPPGMTALKSIIDHARQAGLLVVLDGKRNDIGSTASAYATGYLQRGPEAAWGVDSLTVSPYLGGDSLEPFIDVARSQAGGIFVLVKTSNPGGGMFQDLLLTGGQKVYQRVAAAVEEWTAAHRGGSGYGPVGAVVGATYPDQLVELREAMPHAWLLVPGYGSQGAGAKDVRGAFDAKGLGAIINNSRAIIFAHARREYAERFGANRWQQAVEAATRQMIDELRAETTAGLLA